MPDKSLRRSPRLTKDLSLDLNNISTFSERDSFNTFLPVADEDGETGVKKEPIEAKKDEQVSRKRKRKDVLPVPEETRRSQRSRIKRGDMRAVYAFDTVKDFKGRDIAVSKIIGVEKYNDDLNSFRQRFYESVKKRQMSVKEKKKGKRAFKKSKSEDEGEDRVVIKGRPRASLVPTVVRILSDEPRRKKDGGDQNEKQESEEDDEDAEEVGVDHVPLDDTMEISKIEKDCCEFFGVFFWDFSFLIWNF